MYINKEKNELIFDGTEGRIIKRLEELKGEYQKEQGKLEIQVKNLEEESLKYSELLSEIEVIEQSIKLNVVKNFKIKRAMMPEKFETVQDLKDYLSNLQENINNLKEKMEITYTNISNFCRNEVSRKKRINLSNLRMFVLPKLNFSSKYYILDYLRNNNWEEYYFQVYPTHWLSKLVFSNERTKVEATDDFMWLNIPTVNCKKSLEETQEYLLELNKKEEFSVIKEQNKKNIKNLTTDTLIEMSKELLIYFGKGNMYIDLLIGKTDKDYTDFRVEVKQEKEGIIKLYEQYIVEYFSRK